jgi:DNA-binding transcriptional MerR regulator
MLRIGAFARLGQVTIHTLRHYDELGLLRPARVDEWTGYRYYSLSQLPRLNRILALKDLGLALEQIALLLERDVSPQELRGMLLLRSEQLGEQLRELQGQLERVEARLRSIEQEEHMPDYDVVLKTVAPMLVASKRILVPENGDVPRVLPEAFQEVWRFVEDRQGEVAGSCLAVWYTPTEALMNEDVEAAFPLRAPVPSSERVSVHTLPGAEVAAVVHQGPFRNFQQALHAALRWIEANGYQVSGPLREIYHVVGPGHEEDSTVEIQFPISRLG